MRVLFTFAGGAGHFNPLVPIARAALVAGHVVAFVGRPRMVAAIETAGFTAFAIGVDGDGEPARLPLQELDAEREDRVLRDGFAGSMARERAEGILNRCATWRPDLIVCDETDFGAMVAAERLGLPYASVLVIAAGSFVRPELIAPRLHELRAAHGLPPDPELTMLHRHLVLSPGPPSFRDPAFPLPATAHPIRPVVDVPPDNDGVPAWIARLPGRPTVYFTLGTEFNLESGDLFSRVLEGLSELDINLVVTVGRGIDPAEFGRQPEHVHIARYIPQALLLPHCAAVVSHAGSGSVAGALSYGLPMVLIPIGADQPSNAARCAELGLARVLDAVRATPEEVRSAVSTVLAEPTYQRAADQMAAEAAALPAPGYAVKLLEQLPTTSPSPR